MKRIHHSLVVGLFKLSE